MANKSRILIIEDHDIMRFGLNQLLASSGLFEVCAALSDGRAAMEWLRKNQADVVVLDLTLPDCHGLSLIRTLQRRYPSMAVIVLTMHDELRYGERALSAGAAGYVMKSEPPEVLIDAIQKVSKGGRYVSSALQERIMLMAGSPGSRGGSAVDALSDRELEVLRLLGNGMSSSQIADQLKRSMKTVEAHRENIKKKLALKNASELLRFAVCWVEEERMTPTMDIA